MPTLKALWTSTTSLHERFNVPLKVQHRLTKFEEEVLEFIESTSPAFYDEQIAEEAADVIVTLIGVLMARRIRYYQLENAIRRVVAKNKVKNHHTHRVVDGLIKRK